MGYTMNSARVYLITVSCIPVPSAIGISWSSIAGMFTKLVAGPIQEYSSTLSKNMPMFAISCTDKGWLVTVSAKLSMMWGQNLRAETKKKMYYE